MLTAIAALLFSIPEDLHIYKFNGPIFVIHPNGLAHPQVADQGDGLQIWRVAANLLNNQSRTMNKGWNSSQVCRVKF
jgi:hypothetical protein